VVLSYDNSYDEQLEIFLFWQAFINRVSFILKKYAVPMGHGNSFFGSWKSHGKSLLKKSGHPEQ